MTLFKNRSRLQEFAWFGVTLLAATVIGVLVIRLLAFLTPSLYANRIVHDGIILAIVVPIVTLSARLRSRWKENPSP
jgi:hypothetical protein